MRSQDRGGRTVQRSALRARDHCPARSLVPALQAELAWTVAQRYPWVCAAGSRFQTQVSRATSVRALQTNAEVAGAGGRPVRADHRSAGRCPGWSGRRMRWAIPLAESICLTTHVPHKRQRRDSPEALHRFPAHTQALLRCCEPAVSPSVRIGTMRATRQGCVTPSLVWGAIQSRLSVEPIVLTPAPSSSRLGAGVLRQRVIG
jgi:hypothetical protein